MSRSYKKSEKIQHNIQKVQTSRQVERERLSLEAIARECWQSDIINILLPFLFIANT